MIAPWMLYVLATSLLLTAAAAGAEAALRRVGRPARWVWAAATAGSLALAVGPWLPLAAPEPTAPAVGPPPAAMIIELPALEVGPSSVLHRLDVPLLALWAAGAAGALATLFGGAALLARRRRRWTPAELDGRRVFLSDDFGPALVGLWRPGVVVPRWVLALEEDGRRMVLLHEEEHRRAGDVPLLVAATALTALLPWNAGFWLQLRRLRSAVEMDCDRRVLRRGARPLPYANLLLRVGGSGAGMLSPALAEPAQTLERRIEMIVTKPNRTKRWSAVALAGATILLVGLACETPAPSEVGEAPPAAESEGVEVMDRVVSGSPVVFVDGEEHEEGLESLDRETIERIEVLKPPASVREYGERGRDGVIQIYTRGAAPEEPSRAAALAEEPTFTPFTVAPDILNRSEIIAAMEREYPPLLREAGIGGSIRIHFFLDETGAVAQTRVDESSGHQALDEAAMRVASVYEFTPALNGDEPTPVWISLPITFQYSP
ncbi:MAG: TonB family protein [Gemmatimonadetes bacterium]|nr:TonB family protein [Gemmatimonadota bacterium]